MSKNIFRLVMLRTRPEVLWVVTFTVVEASPLYCFTPLQPNTVSVNQPKVLTSEEAYNYPHL